MADKQTKGRYRGSQLSKGGGDWIGSSPYDLGAALESFSPPGTPAASDPVVRELDEPFSALRTLAENAVAGADLASVLNDIETLQQELEKGAAADDNACVRAIQRIAISWPGAGQALHALIQAPVLADRIGPNTRATIDGVAAG